LQLKAVNRELLRRRHHAGVVDEHVKRAVETGRELANRPKVPQIDLAGPDLGARHLSGDALDSLVAPLQLPTGQSHGRPAASELQCDLKTQATVSPRHHCHPPTQVRHLL